jgi:hypothetical protein
MCVDGIFRVVPFISHAVNGHGQKECRHGAGYHAFLSVRSQP